MLPDPLHPAIVHFPIVLAILAPLFALGALWAIGRGADRLRAWGLATLVVGALAGSAWLATETGEQQQRRVERVVGERPMETHEEAAEAFLYSAAGVLVVVAVGLASGVVGRIGRVAGTAGTLALVVLGWRVGHSGGALVYQHGAASAYTNGAGRTTVPVGAPRERESDDAALPAVPRALVAAVLPRAADAQAVPASPADAIRIPESVREEHREIHAALDRATRAPGRVGQAARELARVLHPHFVREEQIALPPLGLLVPLARSEMSADMRRVLPLTDSLRAELPRMLDEHATIRAATQRLGAVARAQGNAAVVRLAEALKLHARSEEEVYYPAAVLVGDLVRGRSVASAGR